MENDLHSDQMACSSGSFTTDQNMHLITHKPDHGSLDLDLPTIIKNIKARIMAEGNKNDASVTELLVMVDQLASFEFGQFLLKYGGLNGFWTQYVVLYPKWSQNSEKRDSTTDFERWFLEKRPGSRATQERFTIFQKLIQNFIKKRSQENLVLASIPCGMMDDLLTLDLPEDQSIKLVGIDLDQDSLIGARQNAKRLGLESRSEFHQMNAWEMHVEEQFDLLTSNGLNIYEQDDRKVAELYRKFYTALKANGVLVASFSTPPPWLDPTSPWEMSSINQADLLRQKIIYSYIIQPKWQAYRTETKTIEQLKEAGFVDVQIIYDECKMFPTLLALK